jgi:hypothetical protein
LVHLAIAVGLIVMKVLSVIAWPWIWVTAPIWIPVVLAIVCVIVMFVSFVRSPHR